MFIFESATLKRSRSVFYLSYPQSENENHEELNKYFRQIGEEIKLSFEGNVGDEIMRLGGDGTKGYAFFDITCTNEQFFSGLIVISGYSKAELIYFRCMPICLDITKASHIPVWSFAGKINKKINNIEKNTPYCIINNTAYSVNNLYSGQRLRLRRKNYRSLLRLDPLCKVI